MTARDHARKGGGRDAAYHRGPALRRPRKHAFMTSRDFQDTSRYGGNPMKLSSSRAIGNIGLLFTIVGGWFFVAGFEQPWSAGHIGTLVFLIFGLVLCIVGAAFSGSKRRVDRRIVNPSH